MGRRGYLPEFRRRVLVEFGYTVSDVDLQISQKTIYVWLGRTALTAVPSPA